MAAAPAASRPGGIPINRGPFPFSVASSRRYIPPSSREGSRRAVNGAGFRGRAGDLVSRFAMGVARFQRSAFGVSAQMMLGSSRTPVKGKSRTPGK